MDRLTLFSALLILISFSEQTFSAGRKKIRIHIPQKVKHIHHHKKIYITQHQATPTPFAPQYASTEQYAPAYLGSEALPGLALLPLSEERAGAAPPNLLPLYRARGHYGPTPVYRGAKQRLAKTRSSASEKRIKILTVSEPRKKRVSKKKKAKRIVIRDETPSRDIAEDSGSSHSFHEEFYSDVKPNHNTFKTIQKPKRVEKYLDGNTEHVHTYSEEHIHQIVYDNPPEGGKPEGLETAALPRGPAPFYPEHGPPPPAHALLPLDVALHHAMRAAPAPPVLSTAHPLTSSGIYPSIPTVIHPVISGNYKPSYAAVQSSMSDPIPMHAGLRPTFSLPFADSTKHPGTDTMSGSGTIGSLGTPAHMEYMDYVPHEASHDHQYHDHGLINHSSSKPSPSPPNKLYNSDLPKINPTFNPKKVRPYAGKGSWVPQDNDGKGTITHEDFSHYDSLISFENKNKPSHYPKRNKQNDEIIVSLDYGFDEQSSERPHTSTIRNNKKKPKRKPVSSSVFNHNIPKKPRPTSANYKVHHSIESKPHSTPISYIEDSLGSYKDGYRDSKESSHTFVNYKDSYGSDFSDPFETDSFASSSSDRYKEKELNSGPTSWRDRKHKSKKKSVSTQNIHFGGQDHKTVIDHFAEGSNIQPTIDTSLSDAARQALAAEVSYPSLDGYYNVMASKAFDGSSPMPEASNTNIQIVEAPKLLESHILNTAQPQIELTTPKPAPSTSIPTNTLTTTFRVPRNHKKNSGEKKMQETSIAKQVHKKETKSSKPQTSFTNDRGKYKYGDRLQERYSSEDESLILV